MDPIASAETTLKDAMGHRTGMPRHDTMYKRNSTMESVVGFFLVLYKSRCLILHRFAFQFKQLKYAKPSAPFRDVAQYNNLMYVALSSLPHYLLRESFSSYVQRNIFDPLGMESATLSPEKAEQSGHLARGFGRDSVNFTEDVLGMGTPRVMTFH